MAESNGFGMELFHLGIEKVPLELKDQDEVMPIFDKRSIVVDKFLDQYYTRIFRYQGRWVAHCKQNKLDTKGVICILAEFPRPGMKIVLTDVRDNFVKGILMPINASNQCSLKGKRILIRK